MSIGLVGLVLGVGLLIFGWIEGNLRLRLFGTVYVACACAVLLVRAAIEKVDHLRRQRYG